MSCLHNMKPMKNLKVALLLLMPEETSDEIKEPFIRNDYRKNYFYTDSIS